MWVRGKYWGRSTVKGRGGVILLLFESWAGFGEWFGPGSNKGVVVGLCCFVWAWAVCVIIIGLKLVDPVVVV